MERGGLTLGKKFLGFTAKQTSEKQKECVVDARPLNSTIGKLRNIILFQSYVVGRLISQVPPEFLLRVSPPLVLIYSD